MSYILITGACGLVGSACARHFHSLGFSIVGIDNDMRKFFFGSNASTAWSGSKLRSELKHFELINADIRDATAMKEIFAKYGSSIQLVIHAAAQPSHDWAAKDPLIDFSVNAIGTINLLEAVRTITPDAVFIFCSTNKVYGDTPNFLPIIEKETRFELDPTHRYAMRGIDESMSIDASTHSVFGASKVAADVMVQEYGKYFGIRTGTFRGGCLTGPGHSGAELHGFLSHLMNCTITGLPYTIYGYKGKQVRDNIHCADLASSFEHFFKSPHAGEVYNIGGSRHSNCSMHEAIQLCEKITGKKLSTSYKDENRIGDHIWWISDVQKFQSHYPDWRYKYTLEDILVEMHDELLKRARK